MLGLKKRREDLALRHASTVTRLMAEYAGTKVSVTPLPALGTFHSLFCAEDAHSNRYVVRTSLLDEVDGTPDFVLDCWIAGLADRSGIPVSVPCCVDITETRATFPFEVFMESTATTVKQLENSATQALPWGLAFEMGKTLAQIHTVPAVGAGPLDVASLTDDIADPPIGVLNSWPQFVMLNLSEHLRYCRNASAISYDDERTIETVFRDLAPLMSISSSSLLHGDYSGSNLFTDGSCVSAVIDWEDALAGDPVYDIAAWATFYREAIYSEFLEGYSSVRSVGSNFDVKFWLYYLRVALAKTAHRYRFGVSDVPGRPPASRRILQALEHLSLLQNP